MDDMFQPFCVIRRVKHEYRFELLKYPRAPALFVSHANLHRVITSVMQTSDAKHAVILWLGMPRV